MAKKYRVNASESFNLHSMLDKLMCAVYDMEDGLIPMDDSIYARIDELETLIMKGGSVGDLVDWPTLKRIREIKEERQMIRYNTCLAAGMAENEAGMAFQD